MVAPSNSSACFLHPYNYPQYQTLPMGLHSHPHPCFLPFPSPFSDGSWTASLHVGWWKGKEEQTVGSTIRRLRHDLRPENSQRRNSLSDETRTRVPIKFWPNSEENPEAFVPRGGSHIPFPLQRGRPLSKLTSKSKDWIRSQLDCWKNVAWTKMDSASKLELD